MSDDHRLEAKDQSLDESGRATNKLASKKRQASAAAKELSTQTDWSWIQDMQIMDKIRKGFVF